MQRTRQPRRRQANIDTRRQLEAGTGDDSTIPSQELTPIENTLATTFSSRASPRDQTEIEDTSSISDATTQYQTGKTWPDVAHHWVPTVLNLKVALGAVPLGIFLLAIGTGNLKSLAEFGLLVLTTIFLDVVIWLLSRLR